LFPSQFSSWPDRENQVSGMDGLHDVVIKVRAAARLVTLVSDTVKVT
jgi:hypothetical protein